MSPALATDAEIETMIQDSGGVPVSYLGVDTYGHTDRAGSTTQDLDVEPGGVVPRDVVRIPAGVLDSDPTVGDAITVDGEALQVVDHRPVDDGALIALVVGTWTHTVDIYRPSPDGDTTRGQQQQQFGSPVASSVSCDLMARSGEIRAMEAGEVAAAEWEGRFPPGTDLQPGDRLRVTSGTGPERWRVTFVGDRTDRWKLPVEITESDKDFG